MPEIAECGVLKRILVGMMCKPTLLTLSQINYYIFTVLKQSSYNY